MIILIFLVKKIYVPLSLPLTHNKMYWNLCSEQRCFKDACFFSTLYSNFTKAVVGLIFEFNMGLVLPVLESVPTGHHITYTIKSNKQ